MSTFFDKEYLTEARNVPASHAAWRWIVLADSFAELGISPGCPSFDYGRQEWRWESDHAHVTRDAGGFYGGQIMWCGRDLGTCQKDYTRLQA